MTGYLLGTWWPGHAYLVGVKHHRYDEYDKDDKFLEKYKIDLVQFAMHKNDFTLDKYLNCKRLFKGVLLSIFERQNSWSVEL